ELGERVEGVRRLARRIAADAADLGRPPEVGEREGEADPRVVGRGGRRALEVLDQRGDEVVALRLERFAEGKDGRRVAGRAGELGASAAVTARGEHGEREERRARGEPFPRRGGATRTVPGVRAEQGAMDGR